MKNKYCNIYFRNTWVGIWDCEGIELLSILAIPIIGIFWNFVESTLLELFIELSSLGATALGVGVGGTGLLIGGGLFIDDGRFERFGGGLELVLTDGCWIIFFCNALVTLVVLEGRGLGIFPGFSEEVFLVGLGSGLLFNEGFSWLLLTIFCWEMGLESEFPRDE